MVNSNCVELHFLVKIGEIFNIFFSPDAMATLMLDFSFHGGCEFSASEFQI